MKFEEALKVMREGKKVKRPCMPQKYQSPKQKEENNTYLYIITIMVSFLIWQIVMPF